MDVEILARVQFAFTVMFHYIYPPLSIGLGVALVIIGFFLASYFLFNLYTLIEVPRALETVRERPAISLVVALKVLIVLNIPREIHKGREFNAFASSCLAMALMMATFGLTAYPNMVFSNPDPANSLTITNAASSQKTLAIMLVIAAIGVPIVLAYTASIYYIFRGKTTLTSQSY